MKDGHEYLNWIKARIEERDDKITGVSLSRWRAHHGFTQEALATALTVNVYAIKKWESGDRKPIKFLGLALSAIAENLPATNINNSKFKESLAFWRKERDFTQEMLASALDINVYTVKKWEGGSRSPIGFLGLALSAIDANLLPVKIKLEGRASPRPDEENEIPAPRPI